MTYTYQKNEKGEFVCHICQAVKKNQNTMHYHLKNHEGSLPFQCPTCKKEFLHAQTLALHISARHSKEEAASLKCPCCPYKTLTKANRVLHFIRKHCSSDVAALNATANTCPKCAKVCNSGTAFLYHLATSCIELPAEKAAHLQGLLL